MKPLSVLANLLCIASGVAQAADNEAKHDFPAADVEFFEKRIRPVLVTHCYECHSVAAAKSEKLKGGLLLDTRDGVLTGGDSGAAAEPGSADDSLLLEALRYEAYEMPPKGKLPDKVIADFEKWIELGLPDPRQDKQLASGEIDIEKGREHWAYRQLKPVRVPAPKTAQPASPIDAFILSRLEQDGLQQAAQADRTTLIRRLYFDLIGLPPTPDEIDAFVNDQSPDAYERLVDRLLASPRFGERWGRHWLDVVRYAESITLRGQVFSEAWRYRDYVIETFNADYPLDRFIQEQVAGDLLEADSLQQRRRNVIATTFLALGNNNLEDQDKAKLRMDVVDEQLEAIGRGFLAQTITCARCHDHKFDPIPTRDYYALAGILRSTKTLEHANVSKWLELPLPAPPEAGAAVKEHQLAVADLTARIKKLKASIQPASGNGQPIAADQLAGIVVDDSQAELLGSWTQSTFVKSYVGAGYRHDAAEARGQKSATFRPKLPQAGEYEIRFGYTASSNRCPSVPVKVVSRDGEKVIHIDERKRPPIDGRFISLGRYHLVPDQNPVVIVTNDVAGGTVIIDAVQFLPVGEIAKPEPSKEPPADQAKEQAKRKQVQALENELKQLNTKAPALPKAMSIQEEAKVGDTQVHIRGDVHNLGESVPRGFLQVATYGDVPDFSTGESGRKQLGQWLTSRDNPLTARVLANRLWHWLFGAGLVRTTDNFGAAGEAPSHPELLDYLAVRLINENWSAKAMIREMVLSSTYRSSNASNESAHSVDPGNRLLWRANRRRLDAESLLDAMLAISGQLRLEMGGKTIRNGTSADYDYRHEGTRRRAVYWPVFRNSLPRIFEVFDFANPSMVVGARNTSSTAPQALFLMNNPLVIEQARHTAVRALANQNWQDDNRIEHLFRVTLGRRPTPAESRTVLAFIQESKAASAEQTWTQVVQSLLATMDFRYVK